MRTVLVVLLAMATVACGAYRFPGGSQAGTGTVSGRVTAVPCAPVEQAGQVCAGKPMPGLEIDFTANGASVSTRTDSGGDYSVELAAGMWKVTLKGYTRIISGPPAVTVTAGSSVIADYVVESGIRVPAG